MNVTQPDAAYLRSREDLINYEDAAFHALLGYMPNCYTLESDYAVWGAFARAIAGELARIEYFSSYGLVALEPRFLTPPDIKRRFAGPLFINGSFPNLVQSDQDYKTMLVALLSAYRLGTTREAIEGVIAAYTGEEVEVEELFRQIGQGIYTEADRNTIKVSLASPSSNPLSTQTSAALLLTLSQDLFTAIDYAKPAHIGLDYSISFGSSDDMRARVQGILDEFLPILEEVEPAPYPPIFTLAPYSDPGREESRLTAFGQLASLVLAPVLDAEGYAGLMNDRFRAEYEPGLYGTFVLVPESYNDVILFDGNGQPTGEISKAQGVLSPQLQLSWEIKSDSMAIYELD